MTNQDRLQEERLYDQKLALTPEILEDILAGFPNPSYIAVGGMLTSVQKPKVKLETAVTFNDTFGNFSAWVNGPTNEKLLAIYKQAYGKSKINHPDFARPRIELKKAYWNTLDLNKRKNGQILLVPERGFKAVYWGIEPKELPHLRAVIDGTVIPFMTIANDYQKYPSIEW